MIFKTYFMLFLLGHIVGDFYTQSKHMAEEKEHHISWVFLHGMTYFLVIAAVTFLFGSINVFFYGILAAVLHLVIDIGKFYYKLFLKHKNSKKRRELSFYQERNIYCIDQILHLICICFLSYMMTKNLGVLSVKPYILEFAKTVGVSWQAVLNWSVVLLLLHKPANLTIGKLISVYKPASVIMQDEISKSPKEQDHNAGRFIGTVERLIIVIFLAVHQYTAIGFVLTAKSIARYDKISKEPYFAEYYLLGTLLSTAAAVSLFFLI